jgi:hypothetical protein
MITIIIFSILIVGIVSALIPQIPKTWIENHIVKKIDPDEINF